jgi:FkbM family methyltransferase
MSGPSNFKMAVPSWFQQPESMVEHNLEVFNGCYDIPSLKFAEGHAPVIVDIGACCGAFTLWSKERWPGSLNYAFEANSKTRELYLSQNVAKLKMGCGVAMATGSGFLYEGKHNIGESSRFSGYEQTKEARLESFIDVAQTPDCDILKVDVEGGEADLIQRYLEWHKPPSAILCEFHAVKDFQRLATLHRYVVMHADIWQADRGVIRLVREDVWQKADEVVRT